MGRNDVLSDIGGFFGKAFSDTASAGPSNYDELRRATLKKEREEEQAKAAEGTGLVTGGDSPLDQAIASYRADPDTLKVDALLRAAGVAPEQQAYILSNPNLVDQIARRPDLAQVYAQRFPSGVVNSYEDMAISLGFGPAYGVQFEGSGGADALAMNALSSKPQTSVAGGIRYPNGVLVNTATGEVAFPNSEDVQGSPMWLSKVVDWDEDKVNSWREILHKAGYIESARGGATVEFIEALRTYHTNRYVYGNGKPVDLTEEAERVTRQDFGGLLDKHVLKGEVRGWFTDVFGDEPSQRELSYWTEKLGHTALKVARKKGYEPSTAASVAQSKVQQDFLESPSAKTALDDEYESTVLKDELTQAAQASDFLAFGR